jgi:hypothetical protein
MRIESKTISSTTQDNLKYKSRVVAARFKMASPKLYPYPPPCSNSKPLKDMEMKVCEIVK